MKKLRTRNDLRKMLIEQNRFCKDMCFEESEANTIESILDYLSHFGALSISEELLTPIIRNPELVSDAEQFEIAEPISNPQSEIDSVDDSIAKRQSRSLKNSSSQNANVSTHVHLQAGPSEFQIHPKTWAMLRTVTISIIVFFFGFALGESAADDDCDAKMASAEAQAEKANSSSKARRDK